MQRAPARGDLVWIDFKPEVGHEQAGRRPALVISPEPYNQRTGLAIMCPVTSKTKGYPFEVALPPGLSVGGVVLADQVRNLDWRARVATSAGMAPESLVAEVLGKLATLVGRD